jgi:acyl-CoA reductase-like NAD-dependent aldehyde dehydrogenase
MVQLLEKAIAEIAKLPEQEQNDFAQWILDALAAAMRWKESFEATQTVLEQLAEQLEHRQGKTRRLTLENSGIV